MKKIIPYLFLILVQSCGSNDEPKERITKIDKVEEPSKVNWTDATIKNYVLTSQNQLVKDALEEKANIEWIFDREEELNNTKYLVYHIGHDAMEKDSTNLRFTTDAWVYVDTLNKKIFEYDLANDSLILVKK
jgi:hypothetical protein